MRPIATDSRRTPQLVVFLSMTLAVAAPIAVVVDWFSLNQPVIDERYRDDILGLSLVPIFAMAARPLIAATAEHGCAAKSCAGGIRRRWAIISRRDTPHSAERQRS